MRVTGGSASGAILFGRFAIVHVDGSRQVDLNAGRLCIAVGLPLEWPNLRRDEQRVWRVGTGPFAVSWWRRAPGSDP